MDTVIFEEIEYVTYDDYKILRDKNKKYKGYINELIKQVKKKKEENYKLKVKLNSTRTQK